MSIFRSESQADKKKLIRLGISIYHASASQKKRCVGAFEIQIRNPLSMDTMAEKKPSKRSTSHHKGFVPRASEMMNESCGDWRDDE